MALSYIYWSINPEIFNFFGIPIRYYGLLFAIGLLLCSYILSWIFKKEKLPQENLSKLFVYGFISIFLGARLGHCLFYESVYYLNHPLEIILPVRFLPEGGIHYIGFQGLASHGGTLGLILAMIIYSIKTKEPIIKTLDIVAIVAPLGACFIRLANLMNSEIIGIPTTVPWAFVFERIDNLPRHPAQLYEAIVYLLIFFLVLFLYTTQRIKLNRGVYFGISISLIFTARFFIEFIKERQVEFEEQMKLDMGQLLSLPLILTAIGFIIYGLRKDSVPTRI
jgi:phosphatidylglycerol:prolipoprotein diacylglycerol transferase